MVGKFERGDGDDSDVLERFFESGGGSESAEREDARSVGISSPFFETCFSNFKTIRSRFRTNASTYGTRSLREFSPEGVRSVSARSRSNLVARRFVDEIRAIEKKNVGSGERRRRFAKKAGRRETKSAERIERVEKDDVEIARDSTMLKGVVEDQRVQFGAAFKERASDLDAVASEKVGNRRKPDGKLARFVVKESILLEFVDGSAFFVETPSWRLRRLFARFVTATN